MITLLLVLSFSLAGCTLPGAPQGTADGSPTRVVSPTPPPVPTKPFLTRTPTPEATITPISNTTALATFTAEPSDTPAPVSTGIATITHTPRPSATLAPSLTPTIGLGDQLIVNNNFESGGNFPDGWLSSGIDGEDIRDCTVAQVGSCSFRFVGSAREEKIWQEIAYQGGPEELFQLTWYARIEGSPDCAARIIAYYSDGSTSTQQTPFRGTGGGWQRFALGLTTQRDTVRLDAEFICVGAASSAPAATATATTGPTPTAPTPTVTPLSASSSQVRIWIDLVELRGESRRSNNPTVTPQP